MHFAWFIRKVTLRESLGYVTFWIFLFATSSSITNSLKWVSEDWRKCGKIATDSEEEAMKYENVAYEHEKVSPESRKAVLNREKMPPIWYGYRRISSGYRRAWKSSRIVRKKSAPVRERRPRSWKSCSESEKAATESKKLEYAVKPDRQPSPNLFSLLNFKEWTFI